MRGATATLAILLAALVAGCSSAPGRVFSAEFPPLEFGGFGEVHRGPLPVELRDLTGTVIAIATDEPRAEDDFDVGAFRGRAAASADRPNALRVLWLGGMCTTDVHMQLSGVGDELILTIRDDWEPPIFGGVCPAAAVSRVLVIAFSRAVDHAAVEVQTNSED